ncbi:hypothetical protein Vretimale_7737 [Volvox reticuliferus]|uniref:Uncharacterized protein n=2 Tax=Volvox reticuliferus TaxID=1737510 RepID=A0A8J4CGT5_9CHLO|nr:hypothetical protein Vretifemale_7803 [Volvox reticuliferus]GIM02905.1 hypothetical protein Vretimale_7737 [Volvox reticuliferus]
MTPSCLLGAQPSQPAAASHSKKRGGGLLSRLFSSLPNDRRIESSSATSKVLTGAPCSSQCTSALPHQAAAFSSTIASTISPGCGQTGQAPCSIAPYLNYKTDMEEKYIFGRELGKGGNGVVRVVTNRETGEEFACKSILKVLKDASDKKKQGHLDSIRREVQVLTKLRGSLNVVKLEDVYEDEEHVHLVMEMCSGGELWHRIGDRHYSERTVASFMRAVLRTLAQCHAQNILHRDIKPGNFMLLSGEERAPVKAIDFGLAAPFEPQQLPRTDLGLEGTPWYMAPETLRGEWSPGSDIWAAGVMAYQLLSGRFPFDDKKNPFAPAITAIWRSVLNDPLDFNHPCWGAISAEARDFCRLLLSREVGARPSAREALKHPWLQGDSSERSVGKPLSRSVVARIQRFASGSLLRRSVLKSIAAELLNHPELITGPPPPPPPPPPPTTTTTTTTTAAAALLAAGGTAGAESKNQLQEDSLAKGNLTEGADATKVAEAPAAAAGGAAGDADVTASWGAGGAEVGDRSGSGLIPTGAAALLSLLSQLRLDGAEAALDKMQLGEALARMGYHLAPSEVSRLMEGLDTSRRGVVCRSALAASLMDWRHLQRNHTELWLELAAKAFQRLDSGGSGVLEVEELLGALRARLPPEEVRAALEEALREAEAAGAGPVGLCGFGTATAAQGMDFGAFVNLLRVGSHDSLDMYDDRMSVRSGGSRGASLDRYNTLLAASSHHRSAALATSCSTIATTDWSRHGPGGSRHGSSSRHGGGGGGDASTHSCASDRSDVASIPDNDRSLHGSGQMLQQSSYKYAPAAAALPGAIAFRFDTDRTDKYDSGSKTTVPTVAATSAAESASSRGDGGILWRFDVGGPKAPPPPVWRFDVGGGSRKVPGDHFAQPTEAVATTTAGAGSGGVDRSGGGGGGGGLATRPQGGHFDRRMHGSNLYRNVALRALQGGVGGAGSHRGGCLDTVAE